MGKIIAMFLAGIALLCACSDTIQETVFDKELESGKFDHSRFDRARFQ